MYLDLLIYHLASVVLLVPLIVLVLLQAMVLENQIDDDDQIS